MLYKRVFVVSNLASYAQSTSTVISGPRVFVRRLQPNLDGSTQYKSNKINKIYIYTT